MGSVIPAALAVDLVLGEPPASLHPTVWMGQWVTAWRYWSTGSPAATSFASGAALTLSGLALTVLCGRLIERQLSRRRPAAPWPLALTLKPALALRGLLRAGLRVESALRAGDLAGARRLLAYHLVSRDTRALSSSEVAGAAISSLAENLSDSVIGPILAYRSGGLAAAYGYRFINTADAMLGYRTPEFEWLGKFAARADDLCNLVPARLTAFAIALAAPIAGGRPRRALEIAWRDAGRTPSPNAGWPMAAMAGALDLRLIKHGAYQLHDGGGSPDAGSIARARCIVLAAALLSAAAAAFS